MEWWVWAVSRLCKASSKARDVRPCNSATLPSSFSQLLPFVAKASWFPLSTPWMTGPLGPSTFNPLLPLL